MRRAARAALLVAAVAGLARAEDKAPPRAENFRLIDHDGLPRELYRASASKAVVLVSHAHGCAALGRRVEALKALRETFEPRGAAIWLLDASGAEHRARVAADAGALGLGLPLLLDDAQFVSSGLKLRRCAESLIVDTRDWTIRYRGAIDGLGGALARLLEGGTAGGEGADSDGAPIAYVERPIGYAKDVAPILQRRCATCHFPLGQAPDLTSYEAAAAWAPTIRESIRARRMPPWPVDGWYRPLAGDISLSAAEKQALIQWIEAGAPKRADEPDPLKDHQDMEWPLGSPDRVWSMSKDYVYPANDSRVSPIEYVELGPAVDEDLWLRAIAVQSRNPAIKQHINVLALPTSLEEYNKTHDKLHFSGQEMLNWFDYDVFVTVRAPDERVPPVLPEGVAYFIPKGSHIVLELHYQSSGATQRDRVKLGFYAYKGKKPANRLRMRLVGLGEKLKVPAGAADFRAQAWGRTKGPIQVYGFYPHMHLRGLWLKAVTKAPPDGPEETLLSSPDYNFFWASWYRFQEPKKLPAGSWIYVRGAFDNSPANPANPDPRVDAPFGVRLVDEMFAVRMFYTDDAPAP
jgi:hypothetical protein